jgi:hypothetical protein
VSKYGETFMTMIILQFTADRFLREKKTDFWCIKISSTKIANLKLLHVNESDNIEQKVTLSNSNSYLICLGEYSNNLEFIFRVVHVQRQYLF